MGGISSKPEPGFPVDTSELDGDLRLPREQRTRAEDDGEEEEFFSAQKVTEKDDEETRTKSNARRRRRRDDAGETQGGVIGGEKVQND